MHARILLLVRRATALPNRCSPVAKSGSANRQVSPGSGPHSRLFLLLWAAYAFLLMCLLACVFLFFFFIPTTVMERIRSALQFSLCAATGARGFTVDSLHSLRPIGHVPVQVADISVGLVVSRYAGGCPFFLFLPRPPPPPGIFVFGFFFFVVPSRPSSHKGQFAAASTVRKAAAYEILLDTSSPSVVHPRRFSQIGVSEKR